MQHIIQFSHLNESYKQDSCATLLNSIVVTLL
nr:MAG TPA: hypothetical protein [Caudoviricetes sp.]